MKANYVCADCGYEQLGDSDIRKGPRICSKCLSFRVVLISFVEKIVGLDWKEKCFPKEVT